MIPEQKAILERAKQPETSTVRELMDERDEARFNAAATRGMLEAAMCKIATLTARNAAMAEALKPFASIAEHDVANGEYDLDKFQPMTAKYARGTVLTVGHFRAARRALEASHE